MRTNKKASVVFENESSMLIWLQEKYPDDALLSFRLFWTLKAFEGIAAGIVSGARAIWLDATRVRLTWMPSKAMNKDLLHSAVLGVARAMQHNAFWLGFTLSQDCATLPSMEVTE